MSVTIKDIAKTAGVSYSTVSKALRDSPLVKKPTKDRIKAVANELGYQPNVAARSLVSKKSFAIGVVWPTIEQTVLSTLITTINKQLEQLSYTTLISINEVESALKIFNRYQVDAILAFDSSQSIDSFTSDVPIITYGLANTKTTYPIIDVNRQKATYTAVQYLHKIGHRYISYIGEVENEELQKEKVKGFKQAISELGLPAFPAQIVKVQDFDQYDGYEATKQLLASTKLPTVILTGSHDLARGALQAINEKKLSIPNDISIISYDNISALERFDTPLSTVGVPLDKISDKIIEVLMNVINGEEIETTIYLEPELRITTSCTSPPY
ncbi:LacI family DNA-binding transcriptional regulator [Niallia sp. FSL W8-1348]|uniref:LacI family DNA-binding transcriptional regulator n=1 Tax=Niallia sp. FSL W8-1348 TaxID=2954656 RepID=UPI0030FA0D53